MAWKFLYDKDREPQYTDPVTGETYHVPDLIDDASLAKHFKAQTGTNLPEGFRDNMKPRVLRSDDGLSHGGIIQWSAGEEMLYFRNPRLHNDRDIVSVWERVGGEGRKL